MINYRGITEIKSPKFINDLQYFDDEMFILLKRNRPFYIAFPSSLSREVENKFGIKSEIITATDLQRNTLNAEEENKSLHLIKDNDLYYVFLPFNLEISSFVHDRLTTINADKMYNDLIEIKNSWWLKL